MEDKNVYTKIIQTKAESEVRLVISEFRGVEYLSIREYYLDFEEEWQPTPKGVTIPLSIVATQNLFEGLVEILSLAENKAFLEEHFKDILDTIYEA